MRLLLMLTLVSLSVVFLLSSSLYSQARAHHRCLSDHMLAAALESDPGLTDRIEQQERFYQSFLSTSSSSSLRNGCEVYVIPVVVHIVYENNFANISEAQILSQIEVLNEDYRRQPNTPGFAEGVDMKIQFCLAKIDPNGNATNGITRTRSPLGNLSSSEDADLKNLIRWDTRKYLNMWVVESINNGDLGYAFLPGTTSENRAGIVIDHSNFGRTGRVFRPYNQGRTVTHEVGHYFGLYHTFHFEGSCSGTTAATCASSGDRVCDTPAERNEKFDCPSPINSCTETDCDLPDPINNYMNYVDDVCMTEFTLGQRTRVHSFLNNPSFHLASVVSPANLVATGCANTEIHINPLTALFSASQTTTCAGNSITFFDETDGCVEQRSWFIAGATPSISEEANPTVQFNTPGSYAVRLTVSNTAGEVSRTEDRFITVTPAQNIGVSISQSFESGSLTPDAWHIEDEDREGSWTLSFNSASDGVFAPMFPNFTRHSTCTGDHLISPSFSVSTEDNTQFLFDYAYQSVGMDTIQDQLVVNLSTNCGESYETLLFDKAGAALSTVAHANTAKNFVPQDGSQWRTVALDLSEYGGMDNLRIRLSNYGRGGQNLYLDNFVLGVTTSIDRDKLLDASLQVSPNPFTQGFEVNLTLARVGPIRVEIYDIEGRKLYEKRYGPIGVGRHTLQLDATDIRQLSAGIYLLKVSSAQGNAIRKLSKR